MGTVTAAANAEPLARHLLVQTRDLEEARERVGRVFKDHELDLLHPRRELNMRQHLARFGNLALSYITYGASVDIDPGKLSTFFLIHLIRSGRSQFESGDRSVVGSAAMGWVSSPTLALRMRWSEDCAQLVLKIELPALNRHLSHLLGEAVTRPIEFEPALPVESGPGASFSRLMGFVAHELDRDDSLLASPLGVTGIEQALMTELLATQPSNYSVALTRRLSPATPRHVKRAEDLIRAHPEQPITIGDLTAASGVSARALYEGFRRFRGTTPMGLLRTVRLERARAELLAAAPTDNIAGIAFKWGVTHLGRFAGEYRRRFGELPSETLRQRRD
jgi:AraC-like DNA-binding protein